MGRKDRERAEAGSIFRNGRLVKRQKKIGGRGEVVALSKKELLALQRKV